MEFITIDFAKDWIGLLASSLLIISFLFSDMIKFRIINSIASIVWIIYGFKLGSLPIIITNIFIISLNIKHYLKDKKTIKTH